MDLVRERPRLTVRRIEFDADRRLDDLLEEIVLAALLVFFRTETENVPLEQEQIDLIKKKIRTCGELLRRDRICLGVERVRGLVKKRACFVGARRRAISGSSATPLA